MKKSNYILIALLCVVLLSLLVFRYSKTNSFPISSSLKILKRYFVTLKQPKIRESTKEEIVHQLNKKHPIAFVNGYWVVTFNYRNILVNPVVRSALDANLENTPDFELLQDLYSGKSGIESNGFAFIPHDNQILEQLGIGKLWELFPKLNTEHKGDIIVTWGWRDDDDDNPWPDDPEPWPPEDDDNGCDPTPEPEPEPWPDPEPWPPEDDNLIDTTWLVVFDNKIPTFIFNEYSPEQVRERFQIGKALHTVLIKTSQAMMSGQAINIGQIGAGQSNIQIVFPPGI